MYHILGDNNLTVVSWLNSEVEPITSTDVKCKNEQYSRKKQYIFLLAVLFRTETKKKLELSPLMFHVKMLSNRERVGKMDKK